SRSTVMTLNGEQLAQLERLLEQQEAELGQAVHEAREDLASPGGQGLPEVRDPVEDGDARMMASLDLNQLRRNEFALREVREARQRIAEGSYGTCEDCGKPIRFERLLVMPTARYCLQDEERR